MKRCLIIYALLAILLPSGIAIATEVSIGGISAKPGQVVELPIMIDKIDNLAGMKLVLTYDKDLLTYKKSSKTKHSSSLMHIVNDKKPGILIIVMAGARGIKGRNFSIFNLYFEVNSKVGSKKEAKLNITEIQLMSDKLKDVKAQTKSPPVLIIPPKVSKTPVGKKK